MVYASKLASQVSYYRIGIRQEFYSQVKPSSSLQTLKSLPFVYNLILIIKQSLLSPLCSSYFTVMLGL